MCCDGVMALLFETGDIQSYCFIQYYQVMASNMLQEFQIIYSKIKMSENINIKDEQTHASHQEELKQQILQTLTITQEDANIKKPNIFKQEKPAGYKILEETENELLCLKQGQSRIYLSLLINSNAQLQKVINFYIQQKEWNGAISEQLIFQEEEQNKLQIYRQFKKDSFFSKERATFTKVNVVCTKNSAIVIEENIESDQVPLKSERTLCKIKTFSKFYRCLGGIKLIMDTQFDAKGFCSTKDSLSMLLKLTQDMKYFENSFKILQLQKSKIKTLIHSSVNESTHRMYKRQSTDLMTNQKQTGSFQDSRQRKIAIRFMGIRPRNPLKIPNEQYIKMFLSGQNERYYLKQRFSQQILAEYDKFIPSYNFKNIIQAGKEYNIIQNNELQYINYDIINGQKESLKFIIKQIGTNILSGKSAFNVSMPVDIFQSRSLLQRSATSFGYAPSYLCPMAQEDPLTQMKKVVSFIVTIPTLELFMQKPFNPILGQTFQTYIMGIPIYYEQICHHPPISAFYMTCPEFTMYGNLVAFADIGLNSAVGGNEGQLSIKFKNGSLFQCYFPPCEIGGLIFGKRTFRPYGRGYFFEQKSRLFAQVNLGGYKKGLYDKQQQKITLAHLFGGIFRVKSQFIDDIKSKKSIRKFSGITKEAVQEKLVSIKGIWFGEIIMNDEVMNKDVRVYPIQYPVVVLPSDSNFRQDIIYHKVNDLGESQKKKQVLQSLQRGDRKLRQKYAKSLKKK